MVPQLARLFWELEVKEEIKVTREINGEDKIQIGTKEAREAKADGVKEVREAKADGTKEAKVDGTKEAKGVKTIKAGETQGMFNLEVIFLKHSWGRLIYWLRRVSNELGMIRKSKY